MQRICRSIQRLGRDEDGPTAVEYSVMLALILIVCLAAIRTLGTNSKTSYTKVANSVAS